MEAVAGAGWVATLMLIAGDGMVYSAFFTGPDTGVALMTAGVLIGMVGVVMLAYSLKNNG